MIKFSEQGDINSSGNSTISKDGFLKRVIFDNKNINCNKSLSFREAEFCYNDTFPYRSMSNIIPFVNDCKPTLPFRLLIRHLSRLV